MLPADTIESGPRLISAFIAGDASPAHAHGHTPSFPSAHAAFVSAHTSFSNAVHGHAPLDFKDVKSLLELDKYKACPQHEVQVVPLTPPQAGAQKWST